MALRYITVIGTYLMPDGITPKTGYVEFRPNVTLTDFKTGVMVSEPLRAMLDIKGHFEIELLATDNATIAPIGWLWFVDEKIEYGNSWYMQLLTPPAVGAYDPLDITSIYYPPGALAGPPTVVQPGPAPMKGDTGDPATLYAQPDEPIPDVTVGQYAVLWVDTDEETASGGGGGTVILDGDGPPADALGSVDDYYLDTTGNILYGPKGEAGTPEITSGTLFTDQVGESVGSPVSDGDAGVVYGCIGSLITFETDGHITGLRYYRIDTLPAVTSTVLRIWNPVSETTMVMTSTPVESADGWYTAAVSSLAVSAGQSLILTYDATNAHGASFTYEDPPGVTNNMTYVEARFTNFDTPGGGFPSESDPGMVILVDAVFESSISVEVWPVAIGGSDSSVLEHEAKEDPHSNYITSQEGSDYYEEKYASHGTGAPYRWSSLNVSTNGYYEFGSDTSQLDDGVSYLWFDKQDVTYNDQEAMFLALRAGDTLFITEYRRQYSTNTPWMRYEVTGPVTVGTEGVYHVNYKVPVLVLAGSVQNPGTPSDGQIYNVQLGSSGGGGSSLLSGLWMWDTDTTSSAPVDGKVKINNVDPALATMLRISLVQSNGSPVTWLTACRDGDVLHVRPNTDQLGTVGAYFTVSDFPDTGAGYGLIYVRDGIALSEGMPEIDDMECVITVIPQGAGGGGGSVTALDDLSDVDTTGVAHGNVLTYKSELSGALIWIGAPVSVSESGHYDTHVAANAWDNNGATNWNTGASGTPSTYADFGAPIFAARIFAASVSSGATWTLKGSNDAGSWADVKTGVNAATGAGNTYDFTRVAYRYWMMTGGSSWTDPHSFTLYDYANVNTSWIPTYYTPVLVLGPAAPIPGGTAAGTVIVRTVS